MSENFEYALNLAIAGTLLTVSSLGKENKLSSTLSTLTAAKEAFEED